MDEKIIEILNGQADAATLDLVEDWRVASPANEDRYQVVCRVWSLTGSLLPARTPERSPTLSGIARPPRGRLFPRSRGRAAAPRRSRVAWVAGALAASTLAYLGAAQLRPSGPPAAVPGMTGTVVTGADELATMHLDDGSVVRLASNSRLQIAAGGREIWLDGRAFLAVAEDPTRPFHVRTPVGEVFVLGTRFDLEVREGVMQVTVLQGRVRLESPAHPVELTANDIGRVIEGVGVEVERVDDVLRRIDWVGNFFAFERTPLSTAVVEVARRYGTRVEISDPLLAARVVSGQYGGTGFRQTMEALCLVVGAYCTVTDTLVVMER